MIYEILSSFNFLNQKQEFEENKRPINSRNISTQEEANFEFYNFYEETSKLN